ncbi:MAG: hypothetical protein ABJB11_00045 [Ferruginibacter sp.]
MPTSTDIFLPLSFNQVIELVNQLPRQQKKKLANLLLNSDEDTVVNTPEAQKKFVSSSIKKYKKNPALLIPEEKAWKMIEDND